MNMCCTLQLALQAMTAQGETCTPKRCVKPAGMVFLLWLTSLHTRDGAWSTVACGGNHTVALLRLHAKHSKAGRLQLTAAARQQRT